MNSSKSIVTYLQKRISEDLWKESQKWRQLFNSYVSPCLYYMTDILNAV